MLLYLFNKYSGKLKHYSNKIISNFHIQTVENNNNLAGIMLWDASFDMNNFINGKAYSSIIRTILDGTYQDDTTEEDYTIFVVRVVGTHHTIRVRYTYILSYLNYLKCALREM